VVDLGFMGWDALSVSPNKLAFIKNPVYNSDFDRRGKRKVNLLSYILI
jgi:hypothetical protein